MPTQAYYFKKDCVYISTYKLGGEGKRACYI